MVIHSCFVKWDDLDKLKTNGLKKCVSFCNSCEKVILLHHLDTAIRIGSHKEVTKEVGKKVTLKRITSSLELFKKRFPDITDLIHRHVYILS